MKAFEVIEVMLDRIEKLSKQNEKLKTERNLAISLERGAKEKIEEMQIRLKNVAIELEAYKEGNENLKKQLDENN